MKAPITKHDPWRYGDRLSAISDLVECEWLLRNLPIKETSVVVDIGCGTGRHSLFLAQNSEVRKVIACDFIKENIDFLQSQIEEMGLRNIDAVCCNATQIKKIVGDKRCDIVIGIGIVQYLVTEEQMANFVKSCSSVLGNNGSLILKHPLSSDDTYTVDYHRVEMNTRYVSTYYNISDIMDYFGEEFNLLGYERTFTEENLGERLSEIENHDSTRQMWIHLEKK